MNQITLTDIHFSLNEIKKSGLNIKLLKHNNIKVDIRRKSEKPANIDILKKMKLEPIPLSGQKKPKKAKSTKKAKIEKEEVIKEVKGTKEKSVDKLVSKDKVKSESKELKISKLDDLEGMEPKYLKKLIDLGIDTPLKLIDEDFKELAKLITSTQKLIKSWRAQITGE